MSLDAPTISRSLVAACSGAYMQAQADLSASKKQDPLVYNAMKASLDPFLSACEVLKLAAVKLRDDAGELGRVRGLYASLDVDFQQRILNALPDPSLRQGIDEALMSSTDISQDHPKDPHMNEQYSLLSMLNTVVIESTDVAYEQYSDHRDRSTISVPDDIKKSINARLKDTQQLLDAEQERHPTKNWTLDSRTGSLALLQLVADTLNKSSLTHPEFKRMVTDVYRYSNLQRCNIPDDVFKFIFSTWKSSIGDLSRPIKVENVPTHPDVVPASKAD